MEAALNGIYIHNSNGVKYAREIMEKRKTAETRPRNVFKTLLKNNNFVSVVETCSGKDPQILGFIEITSAEKVPAENFRALYPLHLVPPEARYDCKNGGKWFYYIGRVYPLQCPVPLPKNRVNHGFSWCEYIPPEAVLKEFNKFIKGCVKI